MTTRVRAVTCRYDGRVTDPTTTRAGVVRAAMAYNGTLNGAGYDTANPFSADLGRPPEAFCGDGVTDWFKVAGISAAVDAARLHHRVRVLPRRCRVGPHP